MLGKKKKRISLPGWIGWKHRTKNVTKEIVCYQIFLSSSVCLEYVNQEIQDLRPGIPDRPSTLPRKAKPERRLPNGLSSGHSVENPGYLIPAGASTSPAFDNPYYLDLVAKAKAVAGAAGMDGPEAAERDGGRHVNGFVTPTAENPEYLGLADTWSGYTWGEGVWVMWWTREESQIVFNWGKMNVCVTVSDDGNSMCTRIRMGVAVVRQITQLWHTTTRHSVALIWCPWHHLYSCLPLSSLCDC